MAFFFLKIKFMVITQCLPCNHQPAVWPSPVQKVVVFQIKIEWKVDAIIRQGGASWSMMYENNIKGCGKLIGPVFVLFISISLTIKCINYIVTTFLLRKLDLSKHMQ